MDYNMHFNIALDEVMMIRNPHGVDQESLKLGSQILNQQQFINIGGDEFDDYQSVIMGAREATKRCIYNIVAQLINEKAPHCKIIVLSKDRVGMVRLPFVFIDTKINCLLVLREMSKGLRWQTDDYVPEDIKPIIEKTGISTFKDVYILHDYAYLQFVGHNEDTSDPSRGCNAYSFTWLFDTYFGSDEYIQFKEALKSYREKVDAYLGYTAMRSLNSAALVNFKKVTERSITAFEYKQILTRPIPNPKNNRSYYINGPEELKKLSRQFFDHKVYMTLLGTRDFAESIITAEWLLDSMKKAHAVDLTVIGTGYFKAAEQLLFDLVRLEDPTFSKDSTLGDYATFYKNNEFAMLRNDVHWSTRKYTIESIYAYAKLRNGYFHKDNIRDITIIKNIRTATFILFFLLLGCSNLSSASLKQLGTPDASEFDDFTKLCEYVDFHLGEIFCVETGEGVEHWLTADTTLRPRFAKYKGTKCACLSDPISKASYVITTGNMPVRVWAGRLNIIPAKTIQFDGWVKEYLVFENGKFVGPSIVDEEGFNY